MLAFNSKTNTIIVDDNSDFLVDSGLFFIHQMRKMAMEENPPARVLSDWKVIEEWLGCSGNQLSKEHEATISKAWKAYIAIGLAPSFELQEAFDSFSKQYLEAGYSYKEDKAPTEVMNVFDRLLATAEQLSAKRKHDWAEEKKRLEGALKGLKKKPSMKRRLTLLSKNTRMFVVAAVTWFVWVIFRTSDNYELFGIDFDRWDDDMFLVNVLLPIGLAFIVFKAFKWITSATK